MTITLDNRDEVLLLFGSRDQNLRAIRDALGVRLVARGDTVQVDGPEDKVGQAECVFQQLRDILRRQGSLSTEEVRTILEVVQHGGDRQGQQNLAAMDGGRHVRPRTDGQARYVHAMHENDLTFCIGRPELARLI
jgi:phosphate starvation-inducible PhoH-like protein